METIADRTSLIDLRHQGRLNVIAAAVLELDSGVAIVDPGPTSALPTLRASLGNAGIAMTDIHAILATHIHLDHAGACGSVVAEHPAVRVFVHERGAPHMIDPTKLVASASRLFGDHMQQLWGDCLPVPRENLEILGGDQPISVGGRPLAVAYTPGHASHHVSYLDEWSGTAFAGDAAGGRIRNGDVVLPATPPPDIDVDSIGASFARMLEWQPDRLCLTHFGVALDPTAHGSQLRDRLTSWAVYVRESLEDGASDPERSERFARWVGDDLRQTLTEEEAVAYERGAPPALSWYGLARYWRKKAANSRAEGVDR